MQMRVLKLQLNSKQEIPRLHLGTAVDRRETTR